MADWPLDQELHVDHVNAGRLKRPPGFRLKSVSGKTKSDGSTSTESDAVRNTISILARSILIATFALWFGGFTFYVSFVVPIGTEILGSATRQGFITQQVTHWLNVVCGAAAGLMLLESLAQWKRCPRPWREIQLAMVVVISGSLVALVLLHIQMDTLLDFERARVSERTRFYGLHRIYLWLSTFQWIAGWIWLIVAVTGWRRIDD